MPDTTWAATRVGSPAPKLCAPSNTKSVAPKLTNALVRNPAVRARHCRSEEAESDAECDVEHVH